MKKRMRLLFLIFLVAVFWGNSYQGAAAETKKKGQNMAAELRDKTFFMVEVARGNEAEKDYYGYFKKDGALAIKFTATHSKSGKWQVDNKDNLCITKIRHKSNKNSLHVTQCGKIVKSSASSYRWYDGNGELRANFSLKGKGNRLP